MYFMPLPHLHFAFATWDPISGVAPDLLVLYFAHCSILHGLDAFLSVSALQHPCVSYVGLRNPALCISDVILGGIPGC